MIKNITIFFLFAVALSIPSNSKAWINLTTQGNEFFGVVNDTEVRIYLNDQIYVGQGYDAFYNRTLNIHLFNLENESLFSNRLEEFSVVSRSGRIQDSSDTTHFLKGIISNNLEVCIIRFVGGGFIVCHVDHKENTIRYIFATFVYSDLKLSMQFPTDDTLLVVDQSGREIFRLNAATEESQILVRPQEKKSSGCSIM